MTVEEPVPGGRLEHDLEAGAEPRSSWAPGPWDDEADRYEWRHFGFPCLIVRSPFGALCGYVGVDNAHPWYGLDFGDARLEDVRVHGGLTYSSKCQKYVCHTPREGESTDVWWLGFDCAHYQDRQPALEATLRTLRALRAPRDAEWLKLEAVAGLERNLALPGSVYRDVDYVTAEVRTLAKQALLARHPTERPPTP